MSNSKHAFKAKCPCGMLKNLVGNWVKSANEKGLPLTLPEEKCPSCALDIVNGSAVPRRKMESDNPIVVL